MAKFDVQDYSDALNKQFKALESIDEIAPKMLERATPAVQKELKSALSVHNQTGQMINSIKPTKPKKGKRGWTSTVRPTGRDDKGVRNMEKLVYLQYGTSKQVATPVLEQVVNKSADEVEKLMQEVFNEEMSK